MNFEWTPGKLILFGEYAVILGGSALVIPLQQFGGRLSLEQTQSSKAIESNAHIQAWFEWLIHQEDTLQQTFQIEILSKHVQQGLWFDSNIPHQSGLGSSGALVASLFNHYVKPEYKKLALSERKHILARLEGYFHSTSSGIDPLVSSVNQPVLLQDGKVEAIDSPAFLSKLKLYLIPTHGKGITRDLVQRFKKDLQVPSYQRAFTEDYLPLNNAIIQALIHGEKETFQSLLSQLAPKQIQFFPTLFDESSAQLVRKSEGQYYKLKLCGSGGGGFLLAISASGEKMPEEFKALGVIEIRSNS